MTQSPVRKFASLSRDYYIYAGFILVVVFIFSLWSAIALYNSQKTSIQNQLISQSQIIDNVLSSYLNYISHIAEDKGYKIALKKGDPKYISYLFKRNFFFPVTKSGLQEKAFIWPHFDWIDAAGNIIVKSEIGILTKPEKAEDEKHLYQSTVNNWQLNLSDPYYNKAEGKIFIDASLGVADLDSEKHIGSITTKFNIRKLVESIKTDLKSDTKFIILNEELKIIARSDNNSFDDNDFFSKKLINTNSKQDLVVIEDQLKYHGNTYKIYQKSSNYPFIILTGYNTNSFNKEFIINLFGRFIALFGTAFFIVIILFYQRNKIIKPVNNLARITKELSQGGGDIEIVNYIKNNKEKYSSEIYELYQGILLTKGLIDKEKENNLKLIDLNSKLEHQNDLAKKSKKSRDKFLFETKKDIIEDAIIKIAKDITTILEHEEGNIGMSKKTLIDLHKKMLGSCAKIISYVSDNLNLSYVGIKKIIGEAIDMANYDASINNIKLFCNISDQIDDIYVDERSIKHVIVSLINYAMEDRKRDEKNSFVKISAKMSGENNHRFLEIIFEDNGHGISEEMRVNFQQNAEKEGKENNASLSLYAIKSILTSHNSILEINNEISKGSVMVIKIPYNAKNNSEEIVNSNDNNIIDNVVGIFPNNKIS